MSADHTCKKGGCPKCYTDGENDGYSWGLVEGTLSTLIELGWMCGDCGNTYGPDVESCPNKALDKAHLEAKEWAREREQK